VKPGTYIYEHPLYYEIGFCRNRIDRHVDFMLRCFREQCKGRDPQSVLDNGCGVGQYLQKLAAAGLGVCGYDLSPQMVEYAAGKVAKITHQAKLFTADLRAFSTPCKYDLAISTNGSFQHLYTVCDVVSHLQCASRALKKRGLYIIPLPTPEELIASPPGSIDAQWTRSRGGISVAVDFTYRQGPIEWATQTFSGRAKIRVDDHGKRLHLDMPYRYRIFFPQELEALVKVSGCFEIVDFYGDYDTTRRYSAMRRPKSLIAVLRNKG